MSGLAGKNVVVIGGSSGVGRAIVETVAREGGHVLAVARQEEPLRRLVRDCPGVKTLSLDATREDAPSKVFDALRPDILVICGGAYPPTAPLHELSWSEFAINWESDVKIAFHFCKAALSLPLGSGASIVLVSSGAAIGGSPISGGYAGAKRTQMFMASYAQKESDRLGLGLRFVALAPRIMPDTALGKYAVAGYSRYLGIPAEDFIGSMGTPPSRADAAAAVIELAIQPDVARGKAFLLSGTGLEALP
ncbi:SDR family oxidoreductase [Dyella sp. EPa41]|uniref:SDR family NAD(P)-dependent oxidoreductase n=1 Tax=Dyella sp. EPa41 TaxID=1561194 RepID=UPI0019157946|nr:SDR family oxidoreductase [Dyella sp. EPa41]